MPDLPPTLDAVRAASQRFLSNDRDRAYTDTMRLAAKQWPRNDQIEHILAKVVLLNRLYSTNIFDVWTLAERILKLRIDDRLARADHTLVEDIAGGRASSAPADQLGTPGLAKPRRVYSFATKYCAFHQPDDFQIYDSQVGTGLCRINRAHPFSKFTGDEIHSDYTLLMGVIDDLRRHFHCEAASRTELDRYLWEIGD